MTSFAFILGVWPLVHAERDGAAAADGVAAGMPSAVQASTLADSTTAASNSNKERPVWDTVHVTFKGDQE